MPHADVAGVRLYYERAGSGEPRDQAGPGGWNHPRAGHFHQLEVPEQVNAMIERFLAISL
jgi:Fic family protein